MGYNLYYNNSKLPSPLSSTELEECFKKYISGDMEARETIINRSLSIILYRISKRFKNTIYDVQELFQIGVVGLIKSVDSFDLSRNIKFLTYASKCIDNEILKSISRENKHSHNISFNAVKTTSSDGYEVQIQDILREETDFMLDFEENDLYSIIRMLVDKLNGLEKTITILYFGFEDDKPVSQKEISDKLNISQSYVSKILKNTLRKIRNELRKEDILYTTQEPKIIKYVTESNEK